MIQVSVTMCHLKPFQVYERTKFWKWRSIIAKSERIINICLKIVEIYDRVAILKKSTGWKYDVCDCTPRNTELYFAWKDKANRGKPSNWWDGHIYSEKTTHEAFLSLHAAIVTWLKTVLYCCHFFPIKCVNLTNFEALFFLPITMSGSLFHEMLMKQKAKKSIVQMNN